MGVVANIVVKFGEGADQTALHKIELDGDLNKTPDGQEKTSFNPGDTVNFLIHLDRTRLMIGDVKSTDGMVAPSGMVDRTREDSTLFVDQDSTGQLSYIPTGANFFSRWFGKMPDRLTRADSRTLTVSGGQYPCRVKSSYDVRFYAYRLFAPDVPLADGETYPVDIVVYLEAAT